MTIGGEPEGTPLTETIEAWKGFGLTFLTPAMREQYQRENKCEAVAGENPRWLFTVVEKDYNDCMRQVHEHLGWSPYRPMEKNAP